MHRRIKRAARASRLIADSHLELRGKAELADHLGVLARRLPRQRLRLGSRAHHLSRTKNQRRGLRASNAHDGGGEALRGV